MAHEPKIPCIEPSTKEVIEGLPLAVIVFDESLRIRMTNPAAEQLLGLSSGFLIRQCITNLIDEDGPLISLIRQVFEEKNTVAEFGLWLGGPRLKKKKVDVRIAKLTELSDFAIATIQECSLAQEVDSQISQGRAARAVTGLASVFAHEIKNPLSGIKGAAQLLEHSVSDYDRELTTLICLESDRMRNLVDRMELFSDERPLPRTPVNIHDVLDHVKKIAARSFKKHIDMSEQYDPSLPLVLGHRDQLIQVFLNLAQNAYDAIGLKQGTISFETSYRHSASLSISGRRQRLELPISVTIKDTGEGVPEDLRQSIFEPFVTTKPKGTGLGLALVAKIVDDHGGIIELKTGAKNTEMCVYLPVCPDDYRHRPSGSSKH